MSIQTYFIGLRESSYDERYTVPFFYKEEHEIPKKYLFCKTITIDSKNAENLRVEFFKLTKSILFERTIPSSFIKEMNDFIDDKVLSSEEKILKILSEEEKEDNIIKKGSVVIHCDGDANHFAIVLNIKANFAHILMVSSSNKWNDRARLITDEEAALLKSFLSFKKKSYFIPVIRELKDLHNLKYSFPSVRVDDLFKEFKKYFRRIK